MIALFFALNYINPIAIDSALTNYYQQKFLEKIAYLESRHNSYIVGGYNNNYIGKYQFGRLALADIGYYIDFNEFKQNPKEVFPEHVQDSVCLVYFAESKRKYLKDVIKKYSGTYVDGMFMTEAKILAGAHLIGAGAMKKYLQNPYKHSYTDGHGNHVKDYMKYFKNMYVNF